MRLSALFACAALAVAGSAQADIITVDDDRQDLPTADYSFLQDAIDAAVDGDEIIVYPGTYAERLRVNGKVLTIRSTDPSDPAIVDATTLQPDPGTNSGTNFNIGASSPDSTAVTLRGFTFTKFASTTQVAISGFDGATLIVEDCSFIGFGNFSSASIGTVNGVVDLRGSGRVSRCSFIDNQAHAVFVVADDVVVEDCTFANGRFSHIVIQGSSNTTVRRCAFGPAERADAQSALEISGSEGVLLSDCVFRECLASAGLGGAADIRFSGSSDERPFVIERCYFAANRANRSASAAGGGALSIQDTSLTVTDSVFVGNEAVTDTGFAAFGGAIFVSDIFGPGPFEVVVSTSTFYDNGAIATGGGNQTGGAIDAAGSVSVEIDNSIFRRNGPGGLSSAENGATVTISSSITSGDPQFVADPDGKGNGWTNDPASGTDQAANNDYGDLRLASNSPAINAGDNAEVTSATDLDGDLRIRGGIVDQGAYESRFAQYFVDGSAAPSGTGLSWAEAVRTLAELPIDGGESEVRIAEGTYVVPAGGFELGTGAWIRGGYNANTGNQDPANNPVTLTGDINGDDQPGGLNRADNVDRVIDAQNATGITIESVTISGANSGGFGGGVRFEDVLSATFSDVVIEDNDASRGGGLGLRGSEVTISDAIIRDNRSANDNGGLRIDGGSTVTIAGSEISGNTAGTTGGAGGIANEAAVIVMDTLIEGNAAGNIGAFEISAIGTTADFINTHVLRNTTTGTVGAIRFSGGSSGAIDQSVIAENSASNGGTVRARDDSALIIRQSTIARNTGDESSGIWQSDNATVTAVNSIIHTNTATGAASAQDAQLRGAITLDYSLVEGWDGSFAGTGSIDGDPLFADAPNSDYRIGAGSAAIDAGDTNVLVDTSDLDGNPRVLDDSGTPDTGIGGPPTIDIGAYEFQGTTVPCVGDLADTSGFGPPDDQVDFGDFFALSFLAGPCGPGTLNASCDGDLADSSGFGPPDSQIDFGDFFALSFVAGPCP